MRETTTNSKKKTNVKTSHPESGLKTRSGRVQALKLRGLATLRRNVDIDSRPPITCFSKMRLTREMHARLL
jgi:hypothetical protein